MIINHNIAALNTYRQLSANDSAQAKSLEKLSSGYRINRAGDDAAGLAISEKMRGQIRGLDQASRNSQDGISLIQTAEGALSETHSILQRMRELAVQASNDTNTDDDRTSIQEEITQLTQEIDRIGNTTEFNTKKLLNGGAAVSATVAGTNTADITILGGTADTQVTTAALTITASTTATADSIVAGTALTTLTQTMTGASTITLNGVNFTFTSANTTQDVLDTVNNAGIGVNATWASGTGITFTSTTVGSKSDLTVSGDTGSIAAVAAGKTEGADATIADLTDNPTYTADGNTITIQSGTFKGLSFNVNGAITGSTTITVNSNGGVSLQIGANENQNMYISIGDMRAAALGVNALDLSSSSAASNSITTIDDAISGVSTQRSKLGAYQNRLEHTINNLGTSSENLTAAESRIRDVDMAKEMMSYTKQSIISQAATAMLAQANQIPQGVLQLLQ